MDFAAACLDGGARLLQVRVKQDGSGWMLDASLRIVARARAANAIIIVNDRADVARLAGADGVHVGQEDLSPAAARHVAGAEAVVGVSTHSAEQVDAAIDQPVDYMAIGPVFGTSTKATGYEAVGLARVKDTAARLAPHRIPLVAIGGITLTTASAVLGAGAQSVAVITDLFTGGNPAARVREFIQRLP